MKEQLTAILLGALLDTVKNKLEEEKAKERAELDAKALAGKLAEEVRLENELAGLELAPDSEEDKFLDDPKVNLLAGLSVETDKVSIYLYNFDGETKYCLISFVDGNSTRRLDFESQVEALEQFAANSSALLTNTAVKVALDLDNADKEDVVEPPQEEVDPEFNMADLMGSQEEVSTLSEMVERMKGASLH